MDAAASQSDPPPLCSVVVVNWNGLADTLACVESLLAQTWPAVEIQVVDNGSANGEADALERAFGARIRLIRHADNRGFTGGNNPGMQRALDEGRARYVALLNNDAVAAPDWLERLVGFAEAHANAALLASHMVFFDDPSTTENCGIDLLTSGEAVPRGRGRPASAFTEPARVLGACGGAVLYRADALRTHGLFRDDFFANFEDVDLSLRMLACGAECWFVPGTLVRHRLNASIAKVRNDTFRIRSVRNLTRAVWINLPWPVLLLNAPALLISHVLVPLLAPLVGQRDLARILRAGRRAAFRDEPSIRTLRRELAPRRRGSAMAMWWRTRSFLGVYLRYLIDVVVLRRRRYME